MNKWMILVGLAALPVGAPAIAQLPGDDGSRFSAGPGSWVSVPEMFHGRWMRAETGCSDDPAEIATIISEIGLRREEIWVEPTSIVDRSADGRRLEMETDQYFEAPPEPYRSIWQLSEDGRTLTISDARAAVNGEGVAGDSVETTSLVRCGG